MLSIQEKKRRGEILALKRAAEGLKQEQLADEIGMDAKTVSNIETGKTWSPKTAGKIMERLGMSYDDLNGEASQGDADVQRARADARFWLSLPRDVQVALIAVGTWLSSYSEDDQIDEIVALSEFMRRRDRERGGA